MYRALFKSPIASKRMSTSSAAAVSAATPVSAKKPTTVQPQWYPQEASESPVLKVYNSLTRTKTEFVPIVPNHITWYSCGPTVYTHSHMGHARNYVSTDINRRLLQDYFGYNVKFIQNVTDIDDKIIIAARHQHLYEQEVTTKFKSVDAELLKLAEDALVEYVNKNLPQFTGKDIKQEFGNWTKTVNVQEQAVTIPKFPMYVKAANDAHSAITTPNIPLEEFFTKVQDVTMPFLDKTLGSGINDPSIFRKLPSFWENNFNEDMAKLNVLPSSITTRVSEYIPDIITYVEKIIANGYAYATNDGSVYFDTAKFENSLNHDYAKLQPWNKGDMSLINDGEGSLTTGQETKKNAADFALWKTSKPGEPEWTSPWGQGRPGWHIECSVMASDTAGECMDIHSGGVDLCFPHHDNELAQSEAYYDNKQWVNYFLHNGHLHIQGQKMSKSLKNFITIQEALDSYSPRQLRLVFAMNAWEKTIDFKDSFIKEVKALESTFSKFFTTVRALNNDNKHSISEGEYISKRLGPVEKQLYDDLATAQTDVHAAFCDNLSTYQALRSMQELVSKSNNYIQATSTSNQNELRIEPLLEVVRWISKILNILGFEVRSDNLGWSDSSSSSSNQGGASTEDIAMPYVKALSQFRDSVRNLAINKEDYSKILAATDLLRSDLIKLGISLDDRPNNLPALVKFLNPQEQEELINQQAEKEKLALEKQKKKEQAALANAQKEKERLEKMKINPVDMFKDSSLYSEWDEEGLPLKDIKGEEVSKSMRKKLTKQQQQQQKQYQEYLKLIE